MRSEPPKQTQGRPRLATPPKTSRSQLDGREPAGGVRPLIPRRGRVGAASQATSVGPDKGA